MLTLYATAESLYCAKLRVLLRYKNIAWHELTPVEGCGSAQYRKLIPSGTIPAIVDGEVVIADSEAIAEYLNEIKPQPAMLPSNAVARAHCRERSRFHDTRLEPELRRLFVHADPSAYDGEVVRQQTDMLNQRLAELARLIGADNTLDSTRLTLGDCGFPITFAWLDAFAKQLNFELEWAGNLCDYRGRIERHASVRQELDSYSGAIQEWLQMKAQA